jgi:hypothetical protein
MQPESKLEKARVKRVCKLNAVLRQRWPEDWQEWKVDHEGNAAYRRRLWFNKDCLTIWTRVRDKSGKNWRNMGEIVDGVLHSTLWKRHKKLRCYCIARYVIEHAAEFGFTHIEHSGNVYTVEQLLACPELPREASATFERQIQLPE